MSHGDFLVYALHTNLYTPVMKATLRGEKKESSRRGWGQYSVITTTIIIITSIIIIIKIIWGLASLKWGYSSCH